MLVLELMTTSVAVCRPGDTLDKAADQMWYRDCGVLPVCDAEAGQLLGVITDRDICMYARNLHRPLSELCVEEAMSHPAKYCKATDSLTQAEAIMSQACVRRLPVVEESGQLVGIISLADVALEAARQSRRETPKVTQTEVADTLSAICLPPVSEASNA